jgi:hypothetical protein
MRKALIAVIVASALFAVGAFAANFAFTAEDIASGQDDVLACATDVEVTFPAATWNNATSKYEVASATFAFLNGETAATDCEGITADLRIQIDDPDVPGDEADSTTSLPIGTGGTVTWTNTWEVEDIVGAAVLIEDISIDATTGDFTAFG